MSYVDTCVVLMFANKDDVLRKDMDVSKGSIESIIKNGSFCVPMVALGESVHMIREKCSKECMDVLEELMRLLESGFLETRFISDPTATFTLARTISSDTVDDRDRISPMDALIVASAATDQTCTALYTSDSRLLSDANVSEVISKWRESQDYPYMTIRDVSDLFRSKGSKRHRFHFIRVSRRNASVFPMIVS